MFWTGFWFTVPVFLTVLMVSYHRWARRKRDRRRALERLNRSVSLATASFRDGRAMESLRSQGGRGRGLESLRNEGRGMV